MTGKKVLVTGASGFIGSNLVRELAAAGAEVTCLVRQRSNTEFLKSSNCRLIVGQLTGSNTQLNEAVAGQDYVFHLAAMTNARARREQFEINVTGLENVLVACAAEPKPPTVLFVSSLAAVGPSHFDRPHTEAALCQPVSNYGRSKLAAEAVAQRYADRVPISIVRPPIVLGGGDREGLLMFKTIQDTGWHPIPGFRDHRFSVIHCDDLNQAMMAIAKRGQRLVPAANASATLSESNRGVYFVADNETPSYRELGRLIGNAVGRSRVRNLWTIKIAVWGLAAVNSVRNYLFDQRAFLNIDKAREATTGSWTCSSERLCRELGWQPSHSLPERLRQTTEWYRQHGWLAQPKSISRSKIPLPSNRTSPPELG